MLKLGLHKIFYTLFSEKLQGQLNFYNLLDEDYYARVGSANTFNIPGDGCEIKASLTYSF